MTPRKKSSTFTSSLVCLFLGFPPRPNPRSWTASRSPSRRAPRDLLNAVIVDNFFPSRPLVSHETRGVMAAEMDLGHDDDDQNGDKSGYQLIPRGGAGNGRKFPPS